jgi:hypothetical protein
VSNAKLLVARPVRPILLGQLTQGLTITIFYVDGSKGPVAVVIEAFSKFG